MKTIKQLADELGVSKTAVRNKLTPEMKTKFAETVSGVTYISSEGETLIKHSFQRLSPQTNFPEVSGNQFAEVSDKVYGLIAALRDQLHVKDEQLDTLSKQLHVKDKQIAFLQQSFTTSQALHAGTISNQRANGHMGHADLSKAIPSFIEPLAHFSLSLFGISISFSFNSGKQRKWRSTGV